MVTLCRPDVLDPDAFTRLVETLGEIATNPEDGAMVLTGAGRALQRCRPHGLARDAEAHGSMPERQDPAQRLRLPLV